LAQAVLAQAGSSQVFQQQPLRTAPSTSFTEMSKEAAEKVKDAKDEVCIMYCSLQILDRDGIAVQTKGSSVGGAVHMISEEGADKVVFEVLFNADDPLFYMELKNEDQFYIFGHFWTDSSKFNEDSKFLNVTPMLTQAAHKAMEKSGSKSFEMKAICPLLRDSTSRAVTITASITEKKFMTKLSGIRLEVARKDWDEFKDYRVRRWKAGKIWNGAEDKKDDKDKKEGEGEGEDGDKKE